MPRGNPKSGFRHKWNVAGKCENCKAQRKTKPGARGGETALFKVVGGEWSSKFEECPGPANAPAKPAKAVKPAKIEKAKVEKAAKAAKPAKAEKPKAEKAVKSGKTKGIKIGGGKIGGGGKASKIKDGKPKAAKPVSEEKDADPEKEGEEAAE